MKKLFILILLLLTINLCAMQRVARLRHLAKAAILKNRSKITAALLTTGVAAKAQNDIKQALRDFEIQEDKVTIETVKGNEDSVTVKSGIHFLWDFSSSETSLTLSETETIDDSNLFRAYWAAAFLKNHSIHNLQPLLYFVPLFGYAFGMEAAGVDGDTFLKHMLIGSVLAGSAAFEQLQKQDAADIIKANIQATDKLIAINKFPAVVREMASLATYGDRKSNTKNYLSKDTPRHNSLRANVELEAIKKHLEKNGYKVNIQKQTNKNYPKSGTVTVKHKNGETITYEWLCDNVYHCKECKINRIN